MNRDEYASHLLGHARRRLHEPMSDDKVSINDKRTPLHIKRDLLDIKRGLLDIKRDLLYIKRALLTLAYLDSIPKETY